jgi:MATE family multidrug resistance protein
MKKVLNFFIQKFSKIHEGESISDIIMYWLPELASSMILITLPPIIDSYLVSNSQSLNAYGAVAMATNFLHLLTKIAESIPVAAMTIVGRHNGAQEYEECGAGLSTTFWLTAFIGILQLITIFFFATQIYRWLDVPEAMIAVGAPFLKLKSIGIFLMFTLLGFVGFMRGIKNTMVPMLINVAGITAFIFFDYALILGKFGFPQLSLHGSALATIIQYFIMNGIAITYIMLNPNYKKYFKNVFFSIFSISKATQIINLSWPIIIDKGSFALMYVWLSKMIANMGSMAIVSYDVIKNLERSAFVPAIAFAQITIFLISNRLGAQDYDGASATIKKILILASITVGFSLYFVCKHASFFVALFDPKNSFTSFAAAVLPFVSLFVIFDLVQVILAGALRGAGDVRSVMWIRFIVSIFFFIPLTYAINVFPIANQMAKFTLMFCSYYLSAGVMGGLFLIRILSHKWQKTKI